MQLQFFNCKISSFSIVSKDNFLCTLGTKALCMEMLFRDFPDKNIFIFNFIFFILGTYKYFSIYFFCWQLENLGQIWPNDKELIAPVKTCLFLQVQKREFAHSHNVQNSFEIMPNLQGSDPRTIWKSGRGCRGRCRPRYKNPIFMSKRV